MLTQINSEFKYCNGITFRNRLALAPMAGVTNTPFRKMIWEHGCGVLYSEMISSSALVHGNEKTFRMLKSCVTKEPTIVQIYGVDPEIMAKAAQICQEYGVSMLDINMGCPVKKIFKKGSGAALTLNHTKCRDLIRQVRNQTTIPLSVKIRSGDNDKNIDAIEIAKIAEEEGVDMIAIHPRTRMQMFRGESDWSVIRDIKQTVRIPVIGNGDVSNVNDANKMLQETGCDLIMIGRACIGKPWLFSEILNNISIGMQEKYAQIIRHMDEVLKYFGEEVGMLIFRKHLLWYVEGFHGAISLRRRLSKVKDRKEIIEILYPYYN